MRIAVLFGGPYRGNPDMIKSHKEIVGNYDTYVSCFEHYKHDWIRSGWDIKKMFTTQAVNFKETNWSRYRNDEAGQSGFWQFWNLKSVINSIEEDYDWYIKSRSDLSFFEGNIVPDFFSNLQPNTLYCALHNFHGGWDLDSLLNDQFYIGDFKVMETISKFPTKYYNKDRHSPNDAHYSNERNLRIWLDENGIKIHPINHIKYTKNHNGFSSPTGHSGVYQLETT
jgi:hypothetical protein